MTTTDEMTLKINLAVEHDLALLTLRLLLLRLDVANVLTRTEVLEVLDPTSASNLAVLAVERRGPRVLVHPRSIGGPGLADAVVGGPLDHDRSSKREDRWAFTSLWARQRRRDWLGTRNLDPWHWW